LELSDDDDIADKTYKPTDIPEPDNQESDPETSEDAQTSSNNIKVRWKLCDNFGLKLDSKSSQWDGVVKRPCEYFEKYIGEYIYSRMTQCTNKRGISLNKNSNLYDEQIKKFIGLNVYMYKLGNGEAVVLRLCQSLEKGTRIYFDRYFTTISLLDRMSSKGFKGTGIIQKNGTPKQCRENIDSMKLDKQVRDTSLIFERNNGSNVNIVTE